ncbi:P-loop containing nucleoside triphosphate hydrolase protein, partial [Tilletiaria anomala UBC 951]
MPPVGGANRSIKVVLIGDSNVGKSCLRQRFLSARFTTSYKATIGADFMAKTLPLTPHDADGPKATLIIWDTAGQERFNALGSAFYRGADAVILVVDSSKANAMDNAKKWIETFKERTPVSRCEDVRRFCWICVGTKADL